jgi:5'-3' exonuclease
MLGLATHEPNFTIIREEFKPNKPKPCDICGQIGMYMYKVWCVCVCVCVCALFLSLHKN